jgi:uncharacterized membrane protein (DUF4010 family)
MRQLLQVRRAFLFAAFIFILDFVFGTVVSIQLNLSDPAIGGAARDHWLTAGTPLSAPGVFMIPYVIFLVLATRQRWMGIIGIAGVSLLTLISGISWIADLNTGLLPRLVKYHLTAFTALSLIVLALTTLAIVVLGIVALVLQGRTRMRPALP